MTSLNDFLLSTFPQPANLAIFNFDGVPTVYARLDLAPPLESPLHISRLLELLERDPALYEAFWSKFRQSYPRRVLAWPDAPQDEADWARQVDMTLQACAALVEATMPLNDRLLEACWLWPLRSAEDMTMLLPAVVRKDRKLTSQLLNLDWPDTPFSLVNSLPPLPLDLARERTIFITALADRSARQLDSAPHIAEIVTQIEAAWPTDWQTLGQIIKVNEPEPAKPDEPPAYVAAVRINEELFLGREQEQARFREVLGQLIKPKRGLKSMPALFLFYGQGGMGKTQLTKRLEEIAEAEFSEQVTVKRLDWQPIADSGRLPREGEAYRLTEIALEQLAEKWDLAMADYQQAVSHYRALHDKVAQALQQVAYEGRFVALRDYTPRELADIWAKPHDPNGKLVKAFLERHLYQEQEVNYFVNPWPLWGEKLGQALRQASQDQPLLLIWDTYELVDRADRGLRQLLLHSGGRVVWVVAGRNNLVYGHEADRTLSGYADGAWAGFYPYDMQQLVVEEIETYFNDRRQRVRVPPPPLTTPEAQAIEQAVGGMPLLIKLVADEWVRGVALAELIEGLPRPDKAHRSNEAAANLIAEIFKRVLRHVTEGSYHEMALFFLAMQPRPLAQVQQRMLTHETQPDFHAAVNALTQRFSAIQRTPDNLVRLHDIAYHYVRAHLMRQLTHPTLQQLATQAAALCREQRAQLEQEAELTSLEARLTHKEWRALTLDVIEWLLWVDEKAAWRELAPRLVEGMGFDSRWWIAPSFPLELVGLVEKCPRGETSKRYLAKLSLEEDKRETLLKTLEQWQKSAWLNDDDQGSTTQRQAILLLLRGEWLTGQQQLEEAWAMFLEVNERLPATAEGLKKRLSGAYNNLGWKLGLKNSVAVPSILAELALQKAVELDKDNGYYWVGLGVMKYGLKKNLEAVNALQLGIKLDGEKAYSLNWLGHVYRDLKQYDEAMVAYQQAITLDLKYAYPHNGLGNVYRNLKQYDQAMAAFQQAIALDPQFAYPHNNLGNAYYDLKQYDEAIAAYQQAIALDPQYATPHNNLGIVYSNLKQYDKAIAAYQQAMTLDPQYASPHNGLGNVYLDLKQYDQAIATYQQAIALGPKDALPHNMLGLIYKTLNQYNHAVYSFEQAIALDPKDASLYNSLGNVYRAMKQYDETILMYQQAITLDPKYATPHNDLGNVYRDLKQYDQAIVAYQQAITLDPNNHWQYNRLANTYAMMSDWEHALTTWQKTLELEPNNAGYHGCIANCLQHLNRHEEAEVYLTRAYELMEQEAAYNKACIMAVAGKVAEALAYLREAKAEGELDSEWAKQDSDLESLRGLAEFEELVRNNE